MRGTLFVLAIKSVLNRRLTAGLTVLAVAVSVALLVGVDRIRTETRAGFANTISGADLIVGARGGPLNLLLYSVFRIGDATSAISWESYEAIAAHPDVAWTIPLSLGDSHRGYRVLGTTDAYFEHYRYGRERRLEIAAGASLADVRDAVLGADVARAIGYVVGDSIVVSHGIGDVSFQHHDELPFTVAGVLAPTGTPVDRTVHVTLAGIEAIHGDSAHGGGGDGHGSPDHGDSADGGGDGHGDADHGDSARGGGDGHGDADHGDSARGGDDGHGDADHGDSARGRGDGHGSPDHGDSADGGGDGHGDADHGDSARGGGDGHGDPDHRDSARGGDDGRGSPDHGDSADGGDDGHGDAGHGDSAHGGDDGHGDPDHGDSAHGAGDGHGSPDPGDSAHGAGDEHGRPDHAGVEPKSITAAIVGLRSKPLLLSLQRHVNEYAGEPLMAIVPGVALNQLWQLLGVAEAAMLGIAALVVVAGLIGMLTTFLTGLNERRREMAVLRAVGAGPGKVFSLLIAEALLLAATAAVAGVVAVHGAMFVVRPVLLDQFGLALAFGPPSVFDAAVVACVTVAGGVVAAIPAWRIYRYSLADGLTIHV